ncbi:MAG TPA: hypothetical protein PLZ16_01990, partial [Gammaproteobacteria bacterium]|nr:hypothetical protein [Gammaproteobacteria bacterium]
MIKRIPLHQFLLLGLLFSPHAFPDQSSRYRPMAESMFDMMDAFSSAFQKRLKERDSGWIGNRSDQSSWLQRTPSWGSGTPPFNMPGAPLSPMLSPWSPGGMNYMPNPGYISPQAAAPYYNWPGSPSASGPLDGEWEDAVGNILSVANDRFRISQSRDRYSEGYLVLERDNILSMQTRDSRNKRYYEFAVKDDKLVLRDSSGNLLLFRRI